MSESITPPQLARILIRWSAILFIIVGLFSFTAQLLEFFYVFDPNYLADFFVSQLLRPSLLIGFGIIILLLSKPLSKLIS